MADRLNSDFVQSWYAAESALGVLPAGSGATWHPFDPNDFDTFGGEVARVARAPIGGGRQKRKGVLTSEEASASFGHDFTPSTIAKFVQSFFYADAYQSGDNKGVVTTTNFSVASVLAADNSYNTGSATGFATNNFRPQDLVLVEGMRNSQNNGVKIVTSTVPTEAKLLIQQTLVDETPPFAARIQVVGHQWSSGHVSLAYSGGIVTLTRTGGSTFQDLGFQVGQWIYIGGDNLVNNFNAVNGSGVPINRGFARCATVGVNSMTLDVTTWTPNASDDTTGNSLRVYYGKFFKNEQDVALIKEKSFQFERQLGNDNVGMQSEYVVGAIGNTLSWNFNSDEKLEMSLEFMALRSEMRDGATGIKPGARRTGFDEAIFNASTDVLQAKLYRYDTGVFTASNRTGLIAYAESLEISIDNGLSYDRAIGQGLGAIGISSGDFTVTGSGTFYFGNVTGPQAIRENDYFGLHTIGANQDGAGFVLDIPQLGFNSAPLNVEKGASIKIDLEGTAERSYMGHTFGYSSFAFLPVVARPVV